MAQNLNLEQAKAALDANRPSLIWRRCVADVETPVSAALKLMQEGRGDFLLESVQGGETRARHSFIGLAPDLMFRADGNHASINRNWAHDQNAFEPAGADTLDALRALVEECRMDLPEALPSTLACLVGYFGFETIGLVEKLPPAKERALDLPDMIFVRPSIILVFDRLKDELFLVAPLWPDRAQASGRADTAALIELAIERLDEAERRLAGPVPAAPPVALPDMPDPLTARPVSPPGRYEEMVERAREYICAGDIFQVVLAQRFTAPFPLPPIELYRALRRINPSPFLYFLDLPGFAVTGSSPEILVRVRGGEVTIRPIAGTRPRGSDEQEDNDNEASLLADAKERAEHLMLLDLGRHDVGRMAESGSVKVTSQFGIERYSHVMHIVSNVTGRLAEGHDAIDALFAGFPAGTVSGAPKIRACEVITELEDEARGIYAGGVGYFAPDGSIDSCIVLRTALVSDGVMHVQAGAGIVADSKADYEQRECEAKAGALFAAAREAIRLAQQGGFGQ